MHNIGQWKDIVMFILPGIIFTMFAIAEGHHKVTQCNQNRIVMGKGPNLKV